MNKLRWGVLGAANIAINKVIPGIQQSELGTVTAIASRDLSKARDAAKKLGIDKAYGSYDELLADDDVDIIYNPLPNHLHVPWSINAARAGKHVLCEKPIALRAEDAEVLLRVRRETGVQIAEAFMVRCHPQWQAVRDQVRNFQIGSLRLISGHFSYSKSDPTNIRNRPEWGGGGLMDIGCYCVMLSRWLYDAEPTRVVAVMDIDPETNVDRLTSAMMEFDHGHATFTCATQIAPQQRMLIAGNKGQIELTQCFNPPDEIKEQFARQADAFARAVLGDGEVPMTLEDSVNNMKVIDALFRSAKEGAWVTL